MGKVFNNLVDRWRNPRREMLTFALLAFFNPHTGGLNVVDPLAQRRLWQLASANDMFTDGPVPQQMYSGYVAIEPGRQFNLSRKGIHPVFITNEGITQGEDGMTHETYRVTGAFNQPFTYVRHFRDGVLQSAEAAVGETRRQFAVAPAAKAKPANASRYVDWVKNRLRLAPAEHV